MTELPLVNKPLGSGCQTNQFFSDWHVLLHVLLPDVSYNLQVGLQGAPHVGHD
jgi:hypothetical protein